jgi:5'-methylthioadenosine phosphorylase
MAEAQTIGVIGGSGLYEIQGLEEIEELRISTPYGEPSDAYVIGRLGSTRMVFLPRHGRGHRILPSEINFRANLWGMKVLGVTRVLSVSAVGSMREDVAPGDFVVVDQFFDRTRHRADTFFGDGVVAHVMFAEPTCADVRSALVEACRRAGVKVHAGGTYLNMEGPQFSTRAESRIHRQWGVDVIGMTNLQEAKLAREAELCYATLAMVTDYDCWREGHADVTVEAILQVMRTNIDHARAVVAAAAGLIPAVRGCPCKDALRYAIMTDATRITPAARARLGLLIDKYLPA